MDSIRTTCTTRVINVQPNPFTSTKILSNSIGDIKIDVEDNTSDDLISRVTKVARFA